ncbi:MAG TPA: DUF349 domain-containing protein [Microbacteriaceae bacterium]|nr:DUF349 domain-containing protein [Microbacteriaceae bacterium]
MSTTQWGRVDESGAVFVRIGDEERLVGEYPDATPEEALAYFERKFTDLEGQVSLLEQRAKGGAPASDLAKAAKHLLESIDAATAVGDLLALRARVEAAQGQVAELSEAQTEAQQAAVDAAIAERTAIVEAAEALAARDLERVQWKQLTAELTGLFERWQAHQASGPRIPKAAGDELWKRFRAARSTIDSARRAFYAQQDSTQKSARAAKVALIEQAEALAPRGSDGIPAYRGLLDAWKAAGRAGRKTDDQLWERFKAAGDVLYAAKAEVVAQEQTEYAGNLEARLELLTEAESILGLTDRRQARERLQDVQRRWEAIGRVPREQVKPTEDRLRRIEAHVRKLDEDHWVRSDPARQERSDGFAGQLEDSIAKLEDELREAEAAGDAARVAETTQALDTQRTWLATVRKG